jgi:hypothetical protein
VTKKGATHKSKIYKKAVTTALLVPVLVVLPGTSTSTGTGTGTGTGTVLAGNEWHYWSASTTTGTGGTVVVLIGAS